MSHQEKVTHIFIIYRVFCEKLGRKHSQDTDGIPILNVYSFLIKRKSQILRGILRGLFLKSTLFFILLSIGKISFCHLQEPLKALFHGFRIARLVKKNKVEIQVTILYSDYLTYLC